MRTFVEGGASDDEDGEGKDGRQNGAAAVRPLPFLFLHRQIPEYVNVLDKHVINFIQYSINTDRKDSKGSQITPTYLQLLLLIQLQHHPPEVVVSYLLLTHVLQQLSHIYAFYCPAQLLEAYDLVLV